MERLTLFLWYGHDNYEKTLLASFNFTVASVPAEFRSDASIIGYVGARALQSDPRVSYCMYVPPKHYENAIKDPSSTRLPLIVNMHGTERRAERARDLLVPFAECHGCAVLAPLFPGSMGTSFDLDNYKAFLYQDMRFDLLLLAMLDEVTAFWGPAIATERVFMTGFSGGGQFAHRFLLLHPERLLAVSIGAPGRPTRLDRSVPWPQGISNVEDLFGKGLDSEAIRQVKAVQLVIGELDTEVPGRGLFEWLDIHNRSDTVMPPARGGGLAPVTLGRRAVIELIQKDLAGLGLQSQLDIVPGAAHEAPDMLPAVIKFFEQVI